MASLVEIYNRALAEIGTRTSVASLTENSTEVKQANIAWPGVRDQLLRAANWNFARKTATMALLKAAPGTPENPDIPANSVWSNIYPAPPWMYEYAYPSDCLRMQKLIPQWESNTGIVPPIFPVSLSTPTWWAQPGVRFVVASDHDDQNQPTTVVLTNAQQAICCYTRTVDQTQIYDPAFTEAAVAALAGRLALAVTGNQSLAKMKYEMANLAIAEARQDDGNEGLTINNVTPDFIAGRGYNYATWGADGYTAPYGGLFPIMT
jgi:hypothetical protein